MRRAADFGGQVAAINKSQATIEFKLDGTIVTANENFLSVMGYPSPEIQGRHHSTFVDPAFASSHEYREFWAKLNRGEYHASEFKRVGQGRQGGVDSGVLQPDLRRRAASCTRSSSSPPTSPRPRSMEQQVKENAAELQQKVNTIHGDRQRAGGGRLHAADPGPRGPTPSGQMVRGG